MSDFPHSREAEESVLGAVLLDAESAATVVESLQGGDFYVPAHRITFEAMRRLQGAGKPIDGVTLGEELRRTGDLGKVGGGSFLTHLVDGVPTTANVSHYIAIVLDRSHRRRLRRAGFDLADKAANLEVDSAELSVDAEYLRRVDGIELLKASDLQLMEFPPAKAWIDGLVLEGLTIMGGKPKLGKSWFALRAAITIASGGVAFGSTARHVNRGRVLYLALEDGPARLQDRLSTLLTAGERWPEDLEVTTTWPRFDVGGLDRLADTVDRHGFDVVVIDTLARVRKPRRGKGDAYQEDSDAISRIHDLTRERPGLAVVVIHHNRKDDHPDDYIDALSGTTGITGVVDHIAVLQRGRGDADATLRFTSRDAMEHDTAYSFDGGSWTELGSAAEYELSKARRAVLAVIEEAGTATATDIADEMDSTRQNVTKLLRGLELDGWVRQDGPGGAWVFLGNPVAPVAQVADDDATTATEATTFPVEEAS